METQGRGQVEKDKDTSDTSIILIFGIRGCKVETSEAQREERIG